MKSGTLLMKVSFNKISQWIGLESCQGCWLTTLRNTLIPVLILHNIYQKDLAHYSNRRILCSVEYFEFLFFALNLNTQRAVQDAFICHTPSTLTTEKMANEETVQMIQNFSTSPIFEPTHRCSDPWVKSLSTWCDRKAQSMGARTVLIRGLHPCMGSDPSESVKSLLLGRFYI